MALFHLHTKNRTDEELMTQVKGGSGNAFDELYRRYARRLNGFFFGQLGGDAERAADAVQDVMMHLYEARLRYREGQSVATWVFSMAYNHCKNQYRHLGHEQDYLARLDAEPVTESQVEVQMDRQRLEEALQQVLTSLSPPPSDALLPKIRRRPHGAANCRNPATPRRNGQEPTSQDNEYYPK